MSQIIIVLIIFVFILVLGISLFLFLRRSKKKKLSKDLIKKYKKELSRVAPASYSSREKIMEYDKILHHILQGIGYVGSLGDILKSNPEEINDINKIWELHKLRNKLAHDLDTIEEKVLLTKSKEFEKELKTLIASLS